MSLLDPTTRAALVHDASVYYQLPSDLLDAQITIESGGDPKAFRYEPSYYRQYIEGHSSVKAFVYGPLAACSYGLLQILYETALEDGFLGQPHDLFDPRLGLFAGAKHLRVLWDRFGAVAPYRRVLAAYNGVGPAADGYAEKVWALAGRPV